MEEYMSDEQFEKYREWMSRLKFRARLNPRVKKRMSSMRIVLRAYMKLANQTGGHFARHSAEAKAMVGDLTLALNGYPLGRL